jgi:hypothetical protein
MKPNARPLNVPIDAMLYDLCKEAARRKQLSLNAWVREALNEQLIREATEETPALPLRKLIEAMRHREG